MEQFIKYKDIAKLILNNIISLKKYKNFFSKSYFIEGLNFRNEIIDLYNVSLINRAKLEIYSNAIPRFLKEFS